MKSIIYPSNTYLSRRGAMLLETASLLTLSNLIAGPNSAFAGEMVAGEAIPEEIPENVLITGSLIRGTVAVGVPVVNLSPQDFAQTGALTTADLFKNFPAATIMAGDVGTAAGARIDRGQKVNIRGLDTADATRALMMVDGLRTPPSGNGVCAIDPSIIPAVSLDHIDILVDGASATYGSDAISGVINVILKRNYDGAQTQLRYSYRKGGGPRYQASQLWGRTWDGGQITLSYEWYNELPVKGNTIAGFGLDHSPWGYDDRNPIGSSNPGTISRAPFPSNSNPALNGINQQLGTGCGYFNVPASGLPATASICYAVPLGVGANFPTGTVGPTAPFSASTLNWTTFSQDTRFAGPLNPSAGTRNIFNPYSRSSYSPYEQRNGGAITIDQRLTKDISFYGSAFYSNRRSWFVYPSTNAPVGNNAITLIAVPTFNPYYPAGTFCPATGAQPATCLPTSLRVSYDLSIENPGTVSAYELADRYQLGLNIALPAGWQGQIYYSQTYDSNADAAHGAANKSAISAALGWTIAATPPSGTAPSFGTWSKPANVPYLNLFCDPNSFLCNSTTTLNYVVGGRTNIERWWINEKGVKADGPLFDLPGGTVKAAIGVDLTNHRFSYFNADNTTATNLTINPLTDALHQGVWAVFTQVNVPIFSDNNAIFGFKRLDLEASWRHDQYDTVGGTSNPKVAFNWSPIEDFTIKGSWGSNFRAPGFGETSFIAKAVINGRNLGAFQTGAATINTCAKAGDPLPPSTSGAGKLQTDAYRFNNAMAAAGVPGYAMATGCVNILPIPQPVTPYVNSAGQPFSAFASPGITTNVNGLLTPGGIGTLGGESVTDPIRAFTGFGRTLRPENAISWGIGIDYAPTNNFLRGLDIQATYWIVKISNVLRAFGGGQLTDTLFSNRTLPFAFPTPKDAGCPDLPNSLAPSIPIPANLVPSACPQWVQAVGAILSNPKATVQSQGQTYVYWINDGSTFNIGSQKVDGIDWNFSYDWDLGNLGAFNIGALGTYLLHNFSDTLPGTPLSEITDAYHTTVGSSNAQSVGVPTTPILKYRGRLGWSSGPWNVTGFVDYQSHVFSNQSAPTNVNDACVAVDSNVGGGTFPCAQNSFTNVQPSWYSFDLSVGYDTGEDPANPYLRNIGLQLVVQNIFDKHRPYRYTLNPLACSCDPASNFGRQISVIITKTW